MHARWRVSRPPSHGRGHDSGAEAVTHQVDLEPREFFPDATDDGIHAGAADLSGAILHLIVCHVVQQVHCTRLDAAKEVTYTGGTAGWLGQGHTIVQCGDPAAVLGRG